MQPRARFFLVTMPHNAPETEEKAAQIETHARLLHELAARLTNVYVIDLCHEAPVYDEEFHRNFFMRGHMNPQGYIFTAEMIMTYIDYIIRNNHYDFRDVPFIGTELHD